MTPEVRPYQVAGVAAVVDAMRRGVRSVVRVLPTGAGKTVEAGMLAQAVKPGSRIGFLVHRRELVRQAWEVLSEVLAPEEVGVESSGWPRTPWARVWVGGVQSLARRLANIPAPDVLFVDEGHHVRAKTWETVLRAWPRARRILLTATPERLDGLGLGMWAQEMILGPSPLELVEGGYLARTRLLQVDAATATDWLRTPNIGEPVSAYLTHAPGTRAIYFGRSVANSREVCQAFREAGVAAEHLDGGDTDARRDAMVRAFKGGDVRVLGNCELFTEGFDAPACETVLFGRRTNSVTFWLQAAGRCMRPDPPGKVATVIDLGGSSHYLGHPQAARTWSLEDGEVTQRKRAVKTRGANEAPAAVPVTMLEVELVEAGVNARPAPPDDPEPFIPGPMPAAFWEWVAERGAHDNPRGDFIRDTQHTLRAGREPQICNMCREAQVEAGKLAGEWEKRPKSTRRDLGRAVGEAKRAKDPVRALEALAKELGYKPGWVGHMVAIHGLEG